MNCQEKEAMLKITSSLKDLMEELDPSTSINRFKDFRGDIFKLEDALDECEKHTHTIEEEMVHQDVYDDLESEKRILELEVSKLEDKIYSLESDIEGLQDDLQDQEISYDELMNLCNDYKNSIDNNAERHNTQVSELQEEIERLKNEVAELQNDLAGR